MVDVRSPARTALSEGWPVFLTAFLVGVPFGIVAHQTGIDPLLASAMSVIVFAGAAQFAMVDLLSRGAAAPLVVLTVLLLNLRHLLMATALRPYFLERSLRTRLALAYLLTDESFAMAIGWLRRGRRELAYYVVFAATLWLCWNGATIVGAALGANVADPKRIGLDFAITAVFAAIVAIGIRRPSDVAVALVAAACAGALRLVGAATVAVVVAGALAPLAAFAFADREPA